MHTRLRVVHVYLCVCTHVSWCVSAKCSHQCSGGDTGRDPASFSSSGSHSSFSLPRFSPSFCLSALLPTFSAPPHPCHFLSWLLSLFSFCSLPGPFFFFFNSILKSLHVDQIIIYLRISFLPSLGSWMLSPELGTGMILHHSGKSERVRFI